MSKLIVEVVMIEEIKEHPDADRLEIAVIKGWDCIVQKGKYEAGDRVVYIPIDSILPDELEAKLFENAKVAPKNHRIRAMRIRGVVSFGLVADPDVVGCGGVPLGGDVAEILGITKYEPKTKNPNLSSGTGKKKTKKENHPDFAKFTDIQHIQNYPQLFPEGSLVEVTEKIHGTNFRAGWVKAVHNKWEKFLKGANKFIPDFLLDNVVWLNVPEWAFVFGSRNVQLQNKDFYANRYLPGNVYRDMVSQYELPIRIPKGFVIYGEIYGDGIQKGYKYGLTNERKLVVFDVMRDGEYLDPGLAAEWCSEMGLDYVPILHQGKYQHEGAEKLTEGDSILCPDQKVREGIVIRPLRQKDFEGEYCPLGRRIAKLISNDYLLNKNNSDWH